MRRLYSLWLLAALSSLFCLCCREVTKEPALSQNAQAALAKVMETTLPDPQDTAGLIALPSGRLLFAHHRSALISSRVLPGSVMKVFSAAAILKAGQADQIFRCEGHHVDPLKIERPCWYRPGHGPMALRNAISNSCNIWFYERTFPLADRALLSVYRSFGFGGPWLSDVKGIRDLIPARIHSRDVPDVAVGDHLSMAVSPLSLLRGVSVIATGGLRVSINERSKSPGHRTQLRPEHLARIAEGMEAATRDGTLSGVFGLPCVSAKTGTAKKREARGTRGLVVGYAPSRAPRYAFVVVRTKGRGAKDAGPAARAMVDVLKNSGALSCAEPR